MAVTTIQREYERYSHVPIDCVGVKADVQGYEWEVLQGMGDLLSKVAFLELELSPTNVYKNQHLMPETLVHLRSFGLNLVLTDNAYRVASGRALQMNCIFARGNET